MRIGNIVIATSDDLRKMYDAAIGILNTVGMRVTHETLLNRLEAYGANVSRIDGVVKMSANVIEKAIAAVKKSSDEYVPPQAGPFAGKFEVSLGDGCFFLYDFEKKTRHKATRDDFIATVRFADAVPEVTQFAAPVEIGNIPIPMMALEMQTLSYLHSAKYSRVENNIPEQIKYLAELKKVVGDYRHVRGGLGNAQGISSPLCFGDRAADLYLEGGKYGFGGGVYTMAIAGMNSPIYSEACATLAAAELLGGWVCLMAMDENRRIGTLALTGTMDMRKGKACWSSPGAIRKNGLVSEMFHEIVGVEVNQEWTWYTDAIEPGYQCAIDHMMKVLSMAPMYVKTGLHLGDLDGAAVFSLEQPVLDLDIYRGIWELYRPARFDDERMAIAEIERIGLEHGKTHIDTDYTLNHYRDALWTPKVIPHTYWNGSSVRVSEADMLQAAHERWKTIVADHDSYQAPDGMARDIEKVLSKARAELLKT